INCRRPLVEQQTVLVSGSGDGDPESSVIWQLTERDLEVRLGAIGSIRAKELIVGNGRAQQQTFGDRPIGLSFRVTGATAKISEDRMIDAVEISPTAHGIVPLIAFNEAILRAHEEGSGRKGFLDGQL
ncbi:MAG: hypothetical protein ACK559_04495, partial [bacterium]